MSLKPRSTGRQESSSTRPPGLLMWSYMSPSNWYRGYLRLMADNILDRWEITAEALTKAIDDNPSLRGMLFGYIAETKLMESLRQHPEVTSLTKDDDHDRRKKGDHRLTYRGKEFVVETKSLQTNSVKQLPGGTWFGKAQCDASDKRVVIFADGSTLTTTNLRVGEFDVLAINIFGFLGRWKFVFARNDQLPRSSYGKYTEAQRAQLLATLIPVTWPLDPDGIFSGDLFELLDELIAERSRSTPSS